MGYSLDAAGLARGVAALSANDIVINGSTPTNTWDWIGADASGSGWEEINTETNCTLQGSGSDPDYNQTSVISGEDYVQFNAGKYFEGPTNADFDIGVNDFYIEALVKAPPDVSSAYVVCIKGAAGVGTYMVWLEAGTPSVYAYIRDGSSFVQIASGSIAIDGWILIQICGHKENNGNAFTIRANGTGNQANIGGIGGLNSANKLQIGGKGTGFSSPALSKWGVAWLRICIKNGWYASGEPGTSDASRLWRERGALAFGILPEFAAGEDVPTAL